MMRAPRRRLLGALAAAGLLGCGADDAPRSTGVLMSESAGEEPLAAIPPGGSARNRPPHIDRVTFSPAQPTAGNPVLAVVEASDPDGDPLRLVHVWRVGGRELPQRGAQVTLSGAARGALVEVTVTASDGRGESAPATARAELGNRPPLLRGVSVHPAAPITAGATLEALPDAVDLDGDPLEFQYTWFVAGRGLDQHEPRFSTAGLRRGDSVRVRVVASDGRSSSDPHESPELEIANAPPEIRSKPAGVDASGVFRYAIQAEDPDGDQPLLYRLVSSPPGMHLDPGRAEITWQPGHDQAGRHAIELTVDDRRGGLATQRFEMVIGENQAPPARSAD